ncbi:MAG: hypothetical protein CMP20_04575 [Rickettsiales bacterium]|nr:hypothetical protein [Rickettsiales bacterium]
MIGIKKASQRLNIAAIRSSLQQMRLAIQSIEAQLPIDATQKVPNPFTVQAEVESSEPAYYDTGSGESPGLCERDLTPGLCSPFSRRDASPVD